MNILPFITAIILGIPGRLTDGKHLDVKEANRSASTGSVKHFADMRDRPKSRRILVRLTTYSKDERCADHNTRRGVGSTGARLATAASAAVDPRLIPYGSTITIPSLKMSLKAVDTGGDVKRRKASHRNEPVVDVFFAKQRDASRFMASTPEVVEVLVTNPS